MRRRYFLRAVALGRPPAALRDIMRRIGPASTSSTMPMMTGKMIMPVKKLWYVAVTV